MVGRDQIVSLHACHYEPRPDDLDDPDWGWVEGDSQGEPSPN
jgi:hypothetical protein